jgi:hypothetical protein
MRVRTIALAGLLAVAAACSTSSGGGDAGPQCPTGSTVCGSVCSNLQGAPQNCGACGVVCAHGEICDLGGCTTGVTASDAGSDAAADADADAAATTDSASAADTATD